MLGHVAFEPRLARTVPRRRLAAAVLGLALTPLGPGLPVQLIWSLVYGVLAVVATRETRARLWGGESAPDRPGGRSSARSAPRSGAAARATAGIAVTP